MASDRATWWRADPLLGSTTDEGRGPGGWGSRARARLRAVDSMDAGVLYGQLQRLIAAALYAVACLLAVAAFAVPLVMPAHNWARAWLGPGGTSWLLTVVVCWCLAALLFEAGSARLGVRAIAALGVLVATNSVLRFAETVLPGPGGFTPIFALIILAGYAYGPRFGFLMGALTLFVSALVTGGVGPWLPYQMLAAGWVGLSAGLLPGRKPAGKWRPERREVAVLATLGALWGFGYGLIMTLWFWPYLDGTAASGLGAGWHSLERFAAFYVASSLIWDVCAAVGNALLIGVLGLPVLAALRRFARRFAFASPYSAQRTPEPVLLGRGVDSPVGLVEGTWRGKRGPLDSAERRLLAQLEGSMVVRVRAQAWLICLGAIAMLASLTRQPVVLVAVLAAVLLLRHQLNSSDWTHRRLAGLAVLTVALPTLYNGLVSHIGMTVLVRLPDSWPLVGGPITLEALLYGFLTGLSLWALLLVFMTVLATTPQRELVRLLPRGFGSVTLATAIALGYLPLVRRQAQAVREAQTARGYELRGLGDWPPLMIPLLVGALESGMTMAESLAARGALQPLRVRARHRLIMLAGLLLLLLGLLGPWPSAARGDLRAVVTMLGIGLMAGVLAALGRTRPRTALRPDGWHWWDSLVAFAPWLPVAIALLHSASRAALHYTPYPVLTRPTIPGALLLSLFGVLLPALVLGWLRLGPGRESAVDGFLEADRQRGERRLEAEAM